MTSSVRLQLLRQPDFDMIASDLVEPFRRAAFDRLMHEDGCPEDEQIKAGIAAIASAIYRAGIEAAAGIAQQIADENTAGPTDVDRNSNLRATRRIEALKMRNRILNACGDDGANLRLALRPEAMRKCAEIAKSYGWRARANKNIDSYEEGARNRADVIKYCAAQSGIVWC